MPAADLTDILRDALTATAAPALCVAFSGGPDSTALLHALAQLPAARARGLRALHIDHGLHPDSARWAEHCAAFCATLGVPLTSLRVTVEDARKEGLEAAARRVRYAAFAEHLHAGEWLALAHHRDDQVETILLKLLRGAGPEGLGGMRALRPFAHGCLWRPLLETRREVLRSYLAKNVLASVDDPANGDPRFARNVLRNEILPAIVRHWPHADAALLHSARLARDAADAITDSARSALATLQRGRSRLDASGWLALPAAVRARVLDMWLHACGLSAPPDAARAELERQTTAANDRKPRVRWAGAEVHVWEGALYATPNLPDVPAGWQENWDGSRLVLPAACGVLTLASKEAVPPRAGGAATAAPLSVRFPRGGETIKPAGDAHTRELRELFRTARVPPWVRERCPLVFAADRLIAAADLWTSAEGRAIFDALQASPRWQRPPWM